MPRPVLKRPVNLLSEIWSILTPAQRRQVLAAQAISLAMAISTVTGIAAITPFFSVLGNPRFIGQKRWLHWLYVHGGFTTEHTFVVSLGILFVGVVVFANVINAVGALAMNRLALQIGHQLQTALFDDYLTRPYLFHTGTNSSTLFNNVVYEVGRINNGILQNAFVLITSIATGSLIIFSVLVLNPAISVVLLLGLAAGYLAIYLSVRRRLLHLGQAHSRAWSDRARIVIESFGAIREILLLQSRRLFSDGFDRATRGVSETTADIFAVGQIPKHVMECTAVSVLVGVALVTYAQGEGMGSSLGELTFVAFAAYRLLPILQQVFAATVRIRADRGAFDLIAPDLRRTRSVRSNAIANRIACLPDSRWQQCPRDEIRFKDVSFQYAPERRWALDSVDLRIAARSIVGFVGANGSGKTTLMDLLAGLLLPTKGELLIDGVALSVADRAAWHARIAYVPQNIFLLDSSIAENIAFGIMRNAIDWPRMVQAARLAQLEDFIASLPDGYEHRVGERGIRLSGGQRQRIGIARALYREPSVLLMDEATTALDGLTEAELMSALGGLRGRCTIVLIAQRMNAVRSCDVIFQLDNGRITGSGSHDELSRKSERFGRMLGA
jgi:ABC-type multidrug transport system fused ATPase/permease subunit